jgi:tyrosyl-tRNA synthetase
MYGKVMAISDEKMWPYYELLTDVGMIEIRAMTGDVANRKENPMVFKKNLARLIVTDFHSADAATKAGEDWAKQFQKDDVPENLDLVEVRLAEVVSIRAADVLPDGNGGAAVPVIGGMQQASDTDLIRLDKLIRAAGLAASNTEAAGKLKQGAVSLGTIGGNAEKIREPLVMIPVNQVLVLRVGRRMKKVSVISYGGKWE